MQHEIPILAIVQTHGETSGVVIGHAPDGYPEEYRIQLVMVGTDDDTNERLFTPGHVGLYNRDQITRVGFCENDYHAAAILLAASGEPGHGDGWRSNC